MSSPTIAVVCNFYRESFSLPSFFGPAEDFFDELVFVSSPPERGMADEESIALVQASGHRLIHDTVAQGFGALRTRCISYSKCDWTIILDADERVWASTPMLNCNGTESFPSSPSPALVVTENGIEMNQRVLLRQLIAKAEAEGSLAVCLSRRHWFDAPGKHRKSCQNWRTGDADWQLRCLKNTPFLCYDPEVKMHERLLFTPTWGEPKFLRASTSEGPFIDHYSNFYRSMEPAQNTEDIKTYESLQPGCTKDMWISRQPQA